VRTRYVRWDRHRAGPGNLARPPHGRSDARQHRTASRSPRSKFGHQVSLGVASGAHQDAMDVDGLPSSGCDGCDKSPHPVTNGLVLCASRNANTAAGAAAAFSTALPAAQWRQQCAWSDRPKRSPTKNLRSLRRRQLVQGGHQALLGLAATARMSMSAVVTANRVDEREQRPPIPRGSLEQESERNRGQEVRGSRAIASPQRQSSSRYSSQAKASLAS
jgi:hypothetical protein